jgi:hypothetical protein
VPVSEPVNRPTIDLQLFADFKVEEIIYEAEEPIVFTALVSGGQRVLAYLADHNSAGRWLVMAPCTARTLAALQDGTATVFDTLTASWMWLANLADDGHPSRAWSIDSTDLPAGHLPSRDLPLLPEHEALLVTRATGPRIVAGDIPASVVAFVAASTRLAVKTLLDFILESAGAGRPTDDARLLYDLPVSRFAFNSFELSFAAHRSLLPSPELDRAAALLQGGLAWAAASDATPLVAQSDGERDAVLRAVLQLTPPTSGAIETISISGRWMTRGAATLTRASRRRVRTEVQQLQVEHVVRKEGRIRELDLDKLSFILRGSEVEVKCSFGDEQYDDVMDSFNSQVSVVVGGVERGGRLFAAVVQPT